MSTSFARNQIFFEHCAADVIILSSGFKEFIVPVVADFGINASQVYANTFVFDEEGQIVGIDESNPWPETEVRLK